MSEPPRRKRFQIHLSTAIVMMFVAGALIWANVRGRYKLDISYCVAVPVGEVQFRDAKEAAQLDQGDGSAHFAARNLRYGWPFDAMLHSNPIWSSKNVNSAWHIGVTNNWDETRVAANALIGLAILVAVAIGCEWVVRRRAAKNGA